MINFKKIYTQKELREMKKEGYIIRKLREIIKEDIDKYNEIFNYIYSGKELRAMKNNGFDIQELREIIKEALKTNTWIIHHPNHKSEPLPEKDFLYAYEDNRIINIIKQIIKEFIESNNKVNFNNENIKDVIKNSIDADIILVESRYTKKGIIKMKEFGETIKSIAESFFNDENNWMLVYEKLYIEKCQLDETNFD